MPTTDAPTAVTTPAAAHYLNRLVQAADNHRDKSNALATYLGRDLAQIAAGGRSFEHRQRFTDVMDAEVKLNTTLEMAALIAGVTGAHVTTALSNPNAWFTVQA